MADNIYSLFGRPQKEPQINKITGQKPHPLAPGEKEQENASLTQNQDHNSQQSLAQRRTLSSLTLFPRTTTLELELELLTGLLNASNKEQEKNGKINFQKALDLLKDPKTITAEDLSNVEDLSNNVLRPNFPCGG
jgi:hypothetical protein